MHSRNRFLALALTLAQLAGSARDGLAQVAEAAAASRGAPLAGPVVVPPTVLQQPTLLPGGSLVPGGGAAPAPAALDLPVAVLQPPAAGLHGSGSLSRGAEQASPRRLSAAPGLAPSGALAQAGERLGVREARAQERSRGGFLETVLSGLQRVAGGVPGSSEDGHGVRRFLGALARLTSPRLDPAIVYDGARVRAAEPGGPIRGPGEGATGGGAGSSDAGSAGPQAGRAAAGGLNRAQAPVARHASGAYDAIRDLRQVLGDGTWTGTGWIEPFGFRSPDGAFSRARSAGLEGFLYSKLEHERRHGAVHSAGQLEDYFNYLDALLAPVPWAAALRGEFSALRREPNPAQARNEALNRLLRRSVADLQARMWEADPALWGRSASIYMVLARAFLAPGETLDGVTDERLEEIRRNTHANTLWLLDVFQIGETNRWGDGGGSPYALKSYHVKPELGGDAALRRLTARAHALGMRVMADYVPNHASLDSDMMREVPEAFIHLVPPQPEPGEDPAAYRRRALDALPKNTDGGSLYHLIEADNYPEGGRRSKKFIAVHYPYQGGAYSFVYIDMAQIDYSQDIAREWRLAELERMYREFGLDGSRRDLAYFVLNGKFFSHWLGVLRWERDRAQGWAREALDRQVARLERRQAEVGSREYMEAAVRRVFGVQPAALHIDEAYEQFEEVSRSGSHARYNKVDLFDALESRDAGRIRSALADLAFRSWQVGGAALVNYPLSHDADDNNGGRGTAVDRYGRWLRATLAFSLLVRPNLVYNGLELSAPQSRMVLGELSRSKDLGKPIPFDIPVQIDRRLPPDPFVRDLTAFGERAQSLLAGGAVEVLEPKGATPLVALSAAKAGVPGKAIVVAGNFGAEHAWADFRVDGGVLSGQGAFTPRPDRAYAFRDYAHLGSGGEPATYVYTGRQLLERGLSIGLAPGDVHLFEVTELEHAAASRAPPGAAPASGLSGGRAAEEPAGAARTQALDAEGLSFFLVRPGAKPEELSWARLRERLAGEPELLAELSARGQVRLVASNPIAQGGLEEADGPAVAQLLESIGLRADVEAQSVAVQAAPAAASAVDDRASSAGAAPLDEGSPLRRFARALASPAREAAFLARTLASSMTRPTRFEVWTGVLTKGFPLVLSLGVWSKTFGPAHPWAWLAASGLTFALDAFHGIWINSWSNFQNTLGKLRGANYLTAFNWFYGQWWGAAFRTISWLALANIVAPWSLTYWKDVGIISVVGTVFGTLGWYGVNALYDNGSIRRWQRSGVMQVRDFFFVLAGTFFGAGSMLTFWSLFAAQQLFDLGLYLASRYSRPGALLYVTDSSTAAAPEFRALYPVDPERPAPPSPLRQAWSGVLASPFVAPVLWLLRKLRTLGRRER